MKVRTLMVTAVAAVGAVALSAPAFAASPSNGGVPSIDSQLSQLKAAGKAAKARARTSSKWTKGIDKSIDSANTSITRLGNNVYDLRKGVDQTNFTLGAITAQAVAALTALQNGLVSVAAATTNFKYGVIQVGAATGGPGSGIAGIGPTAFYVTPPIYLTGAQSTVTFPITATGYQLQLFTAVRSLNPDSGAVECRVRVVSQTLTAATTGTVSATDPVPPGSAITASTTVSAAPVVRVTASDGSGGYFAKMPQSRLTPENGDPTFPLRLVPTEDDTLNLADPTKLDAGGITLSTNATATLSCLRTS